MTATLSALDATFLELEEADACVQMHIGAVMAFEGPAPAIADVRALLDERLGSLPRYRQRLSSRHTGGLSWPQWVAAERFDIAAHVRHATLPAPGAQAELHEWAADFWSHRIDRGRPLWEAVLLDGLPDGAWALVTKTHHCLVDGVGSVDVAHLMLDTDREHSRQIGPRRAAASPAAADARRPVPAPVTLAWHGVCASLDAVRHPRRAAHDAYAVAELLATEELQGAPHTSLNETIGATRRIAAVHAELAQLKAIGAQHGGTVNDVVLAAVAAGVRALLVSRDEPLPAAGVRAMVPVNTRPADERLALGNRISSLFVDLPVAIEDPLERFAAICAQSRALKGGRQGDGTSTLLALTAFIPPIVHATLARSLYAARLFNLTVTNVPGPQIPFYALGCRMLDVLPLVPLAADHGLGVAIVSFDGAVTFGIVADHDGVPDLDVLRDAIERELTRLAGYDGNPHFGIDDSPPWAIARSVSPVRPLVA
jgi:diacylglycerol O-acyltransferase / wax synthase